MQKRHADSELEEDNDKKKSRQYEDENALIELVDAPSAISEFKEKRSSNLSAPTMLLTGHDSAIYSIAFDPSGRHLVSGSFDRQIFLWDVYGECKNYNVLSGHKNAVLEVKWSTDGVQIVSCSADKSVCTWDANKGKRVRKLVEHSGIVNSCAVASNQPSMVVSGSDDCSVILWDVRSKSSALSLYHDYQVTAVCIASDATHVFSGGIDNNIRRWDLRKPDPAAGPTLSLKGHADTVTGLALSPDDNFLLSNAMDSSLRRWDVRPFVANEDARCECVFEGGHHGAEKLLLRCAWSGDKDRLRVACGSADRVVRVWDASSAKLLYHLPGHKGSVNEVIFHPTEPIIASCGSDKQIFLGELSE